MATATEILAETASVSLWRRPPRGSKHLFTHLKDALSRDNVSLVAAGVAFYLFLAVFPGLIAFLTLIGMILDPTDVQERLDFLFQQLPDEAEGLLEEQARRIAAPAGRALTIGFLVSLAGALWGASSGMAGLMKGLSIAYNARPRRFVRQRLEAIGLTLVALLFLGLGLGAILAVPVVLAWLPLGDAAGTLVRWGRWPLLALAVFVAVGALYRYAPNRKGPKTRFLSPGSLLATTLWLAGSALFAVYVESFGRFERTYGTIAGVIVLLLWLYVTAFVILLGAETNAELERQSRPTPAAP